MGRFEVSQAVRHAVGPEFPVGIRISQGKVNDFVHKWGNGVDDASVIFGNLGKAGLDYIHVTEYDATQPGFGTGPALVELAKRYAGLPIIANGQLEEPAKAAALLATGTVDVIALGKGALTERNLIEPRGADIGDLKIENPCVGGSIPPRATKNMFHATPTHASGRCHFWDS